MFAGFPDRHLGNGLNNPFEVCLTDIGGLRIGRWIAKINRDRHAVADRKLDRI